MPKGDKYLPLMRYLLDSGEPMIRKSFDEIEEIIQNKLPPSAYKHSQAWWSNNDDHSQAIGWLNAGYETDFVSDTHEERYIVFVKRGSFDN